VRADEIVFDRVSATGRTDDNGQPIVVTISTAHGVPFSGYDPEVDELPAIETVVAAIANPPAAPAPVVILTPLTVIARLSAIEQAAIFTSVDPEVCVWRAMAIAAQEIRTDDARTAAGFALLVSKGLLAAGRPAELLAP
jgi:hypothetical protein